MGNKAVVLEKIDHDFVASIRNFRLAMKLIDRDNPDVATAVGLLRASIEQLEDMRKSVPEKFICEGELNQGNVALR